MPEAVARRQESPAALPRPLGERLIAKGLLTPERLEEALKLQKRWGTRLGDILLARGFVRPLDLYRTLADQVGVQLIDLMREGPDRTLLVPDQIDTYVEHRYIPWRREDGRIVYATTEPFELEQHLAQRHPDGDFAIVVTSKFDLLWTLQREFSDQFTHRAVHELAELDPENSARVVVTPQQVITLYLMLSLFLLGLAVAPTPTMIAVMAVSAVGFVAIFLFKVALTLLGGLVPRIDEQVTDAEVRALRDDDLPTFSILVPMFKEPDVLPILAGALRKLDYPLSKLDVKIVLEESDNETIEAAKKLGLEGIFEIVRVPPSMPQTKPKACNYALSLSRGEYLVIFDAEDKPEPDQLKKVVVAFRKSPPNTACLQARLNYFNSDENWLTRLFTIDYSLWFDFMLPALDWLKMPIPLGGTSNHFKTDVLRELKAWDPYNVTEDADLGVRLAQKGYRVGVVNSTTFEEANCSTPNWIRQRSRWMKGYMQTYLVHMRHPIRLMRSLGPKAFIGFQLFVGGNVFAALANPIFWAFYAFWIVSNSKMLDALFPGALLYLNLFALLAGNSAFIYLATLAPLKREAYHLVAYGLSVVYYWVLISIAAYKGFWQLITKPFYWEKTQHGISKHTAIELARAKEATA